MNYDYDQIVIDSFCRSESSESTDNQACNLTVKLGSSPDHRPENNLENSIRTETIDSGYAGRSSSTSTNKPVIETRENLREHCNVADAISKSLGKVLEKACNRGGNRQTYSSAGRNLGGPSGCQTYIDGIQPPSIVCQDTTDPLLTEVPVAVSLVSTTDDSSIYSNLPTSNSPNKDLQATIPEPTSNSSNIIDLQTTVPEPLSSISGPPVDAISPISITYSRRV